VWPARFIIPCHPAGGVHLSKQDCAVDILRSRAFLHRRFFIADVAAGIYAPSSYYAAAAVAGTRPASIFQPHAIVVVSSATTSSIINLSVGHGLDAEEWICSLKVSNPGRSLQHSRLSA